MARPAAHPPAESVRISVRRPPAVLLRQLRECVLDDGDVVARGVFACALPGRISAAAGSTVPSEPWSMKAGGG